MQNIKIIFLKDDKSLNSFLFKIIKKSIKIKKEPLNLMLPGGQSFLNFYKYLTKKKIYKYLNIFLSDERLTPKKKYQNLFSLLKYLKYPINSPKIAKSKKFVLKEYRNRLPTYIDLTFLGMGSDGHVASIFKKSKNKNKVIITSSKKHPFQRCTVSLNYLNKSKKIFTLIKGKKKYKFFLNHLMNNKYKLLPVSQINNNTLILNGINCKDFVKIKKFINGKPLKIKISFDKVSYNFLKK